MVSTVPFRRMMQQPLWLKRSDRLNKPATLLGSICDSAAKLRILLRRVLPVVFAAALLFPAPGAVADDSIASVAAGGITLTKSHDIRMLKEVLEISTKIVRVRFRFLNESNKDIHATVAFPLPAYDAIPSPGPDDKVRAARQLEETFKARVNGRSVPTKVHRKAVAGKRDVTAELRKLGLSEEQIFGGRGLTTNQETLLKREGLLEWKIAKTMVWNQIFPAGGEITVEHEYAPVVGGRYYVPHQEDFAFSDVPSYVDSQECLDKRTQAGIEKRIKAEVEKSTEMVYVTVEDVWYILGSGRNWKGPIGAFTLRIIKRSPDQIVSLCFPGKPKKVSPTIYEFHQTDFVPPDNLGAYFYSVGPDVVSTGVRD